MGFVVARAVAAEGGETPTGTIEKLLKVHRIRRITANNVYEQLRCTTLDLAAGTSEGVAEHVCIVIPILQVLGEQRKRIAATLKDLLQEALLDARRPEHKTVEILLSLPGVGVAVATTLLSEANPALTDCDYGRLRCYASVAPVTKQTGKSRRVLMRHGCNHRVRDACYHWARVSVQRDAASRSHYQRLRNAGHGHGRALRGVCDRLLCVLMQCFDLASRTVPSGAFLDRDCHWVSVHFSDSVFTARLLSFLR